MFLGLKAGVGTTAFEIFMGNYLELCLSKQVALPRGARFNSPFQLFVYLWYSSFH
jgi:hypothetical protein